MGATIDHHRYLQISSSLHYQASKIGPRACVSSATLWQSTYCRSPIFETMKQPALASRGGGGGRCMHAAAARRSRAKPKLLTSLVAVVDVPRFSPAVALSADPPSPFPSPSPALASKFKSTSAASLARSSTSTSTSISTCGCPSVSKHTTAGTYNHSSILPPAALLVPRSTFHVPHPRCEHAKNESRQQQKHKQTKTIESLSLVGQSPLPPGTMRGSGHWSNRQGKQPIIMSQIPGPSTVWKLRVLRAGANIYSYVDARSRNRSNVRPNTTCHINLFTPDPYFL